MSGPQKHVPSEDILGQKYDRCLADLMVKAGVGFGAGVVASVILFRRSYSPSLSPSLPQTNQLTYRTTGRTWPIALSTGFGAGAAWADCDRSFNPARIPGTRIVSPSELSASASAPAATPAAPAPTPSN
ncbi:hypothetical protein D9613_010982 [Agrocybe pediades]|uniref:MICOS complex subunit MIC10 n=1 Tax=Agrocybe pediades TaxID=84607 RepID=A0A8H4QLS6_9AGAR|nr:hypothetical protein D9613_010982 [Agrocybe pediades]